MADVADDAVDVQHSGGNAVGALDAVVGDRDHVAVLAQHDARLGHAHRLGMSSIGDHVVIFTVDRHEPLRFGDRQIHLQVLGLRVTGGVYVGDARVHHVGASTQQPVDDAVHVRFVAGDRVTGKDHRVLRADLDELGITAREK